MNYTEICDMNINHIKKAFAPASIGNVAVGFDMLGVALENIGDIVTAKRIKTKGIFIEEIIDIEGNPCSELSKISTENTASVSAKTLWSSVNEKGGVELVIHKGIPLQSGMGSSAASAVAGVVACNALLDNPLTTDGLLPFALEGEKIASGSIHADNVAPSLYGGMILCPYVLYPTVKKIEVPDDICSVLVHPDLLVNTKESRNKLSSKYSMNQWLSQQGYLAGFLVGLNSNDKDLIKQSLKDVLIEPQRSSSVPCFESVKQVAIESGALGCSLSGSGPSIFALCETSKANDIREKMVRVCQSKELKCQSWISSMNASGARLV